MHVSESWGIIFALITTKQPVFKFYNISECFYELSVSVFSLFYGLTPTHHHIMPHH